MSSTIDATINQHHIENRRTLTVSMDLSVSNTRVVDLTKCTYGQLDFIPDECMLKYIAYTSCDNAPANNMPIMTCDFLSDSNLLGPYLSKTSISTFNNLRFKVKQQIDIRHVTFTSKIINETQDNIAYTTGTVLVSMEFIRYGRVC